MFNSQFNSKLTMLIVTKVWTQCESADRLDAGCDNFDTAYNYVYHI